ncbi:MAG: bifunctional nicotinamidase/pyrazinamidase [Paracoccaceae bacterium]
MRPQTDALIVIDLQNDFCPGGALSVSGGTEIVSGINTLMLDFGAVVLTQDWHPANHSSFAANHTGAAPFSQIQMTYGAQVLWPTHCVQGTQGAAFHGELDTNRADLIIRKGFRPAIDSYSAFYENDHRTATGLDGYLRDRGVSRLVFAGLATDFCVAYSALDAARLGYEVSIRMDLCRAIDLDGSLAVMVSRLNAAGVRLEG